MSESPPSESLYGAQALVGTLADCGVTACFSNPGTSEMHLVTALDGEPRIRSVLCLFEGVATGAADGFARVSGRPAMTLLHLGPGYLNGGANIHNAKRARVPMINVIGDHAVDHQRYDAPLNSDIFGLAGPNSLWIKSVDKVTDAGRLAAEAYAASFGPAPGPVSLVLPADSAWLTGASKAAPVPAPSLLAPDADALAKAVSAVKAATKPVILIGGNALTADGLKTAARLKAAGIRVLHDTFVTCQARGAGRFAPDRMQYFAEAAMADLAGVDLMLLAGTGVPVAFFAYPGKPSVLVPEGCATLSVCGPEADAAAALRALAEALDAPAEGPAPALDLPKAVPGGTLSPAAIGQAVAKHLPEGAIISDDGVTGSLGVYLSTQAAQPHDWMFLTGGAIGQGMPLAIGAAVAAPHRRVVCLSGDGAGMYTVQSLWTMARERLNVVTLVFVNHSYRILRIELARTGAGNPGPTADQMLSLANPEIDWVQLGLSLGVPSEACRTGEELDAALARAMSADGPTLIACMLN
jgi:acetolactate synthase-1/2/3 large subunit